MWELGLRDINFAEMIQLPCEYCSGIQAHGFLSPESGYVGYPHCSSLLLTFSLQGQAFEAMKGDFFLEKNLFQVLIAWKQKLAWWN